MQANQLLELLSPSSSAERPLYVQVCARIRSLIVEGSLTAGTRLPSARGLARDLGVSRTTVETAYSRLVAEGFIDRRVGDGTYVARTLASSGRTETAQAGPAHLDWPGRRNEEADRLSARGEMIERAGGAVRESSDLRLSSCVPDVGLFPMKIWSRLLARNARRSKPSSLKRQLPAGHLQLRRAIATYFAAARGVRCDPRQVFVTSGTQQALDLLARLLLDPGDRVWIEDPHYLGARAAFVGAEAELVPVPVDEQGFDVNRTKERAGARLVYLTPSHQFPTGATLAAARRLAILQWARRSGAWVVEDDYDSEFRYGGRPLTCLQGLDNDGRVIYVGTFNKSLFPALRVGFLVAPPQLVDSLRAAVCSTGVGPSLVQQAALADFLEEGHLARHTRRMREVYGKRRDALLGALARRVDERRVVIGPSETGMHFVLHLPGGDDVEVSRRAAEAGLDLPPLSRYYLGSRRQSGLLVTFGCEPINQAEETAERIASLL